MIGRIMWGIVLAAQLPWYCVAQPTGSADFLPRFEIGVSLRPRVLLQPRNALVGVGGTTAFEVVLNDSGPYSTIVWHNSNPLEGSHIIPDGLGSDVHSTRLEVAECQKSPVYEGLYWIAVTNSAGGTTSRRVRLAVVLAPQITRHPHDLTVSTGRTATFRVAYAPDRAPSKTIQWFKDNMPIAGATSRTLRIPYAQKADEGFYYCSVTSMGGQSDSATVLLQVRKWR